MHMHTFVICVLVSHCIGFHLQHLMRQSAKMYLLLDWSCDTIVAKGGHCWKIMTGCVFQLKLHYSACFLSLACCHALCMQTTVRTISHLKEADIELHYT